MKMLIITAVKAFEDKVKNAFVENQISSYSYNSVIGFRDSSKEAVGTNWYGTELNKVESLMYYVMTSDEKAENLFKTIEEINRNCSIQSKVHIAISSIEKHN
ncbi:MAG: hypothetical protein M9958_06900 [Chitinophagales bacterium]|nr:hypothetical protein [Chitinophagales bacterium]